MKPRIRKLKSGIWCCGKKEAIALVLVKGVHAGSVFLGNSPADAYARWIKGAK